MCQTVLSSCQRAGLDYTLLYSLQISELTSQGTIVEEDTTSEEKEEDEEEEQDESEEEEVVIAAVRPSSVVPADEDTVGSDLMIC